MELTSEVHLSIFFSVLMYKNTVRSKMSSPNDSASDNVLNRRTLTSTQKNCYLVNRNLQHPSGIS